VHCVGIVLCGFAGGCRNEAVSHLMQRLSMGACGKKWEVKITHTMFPYEAILATKHRGRGAQPANEARETANAGSALSPGVLLLFLS
jgi:hypothetical protein